MHIPSLLCLHCYCFRVWCYVLNSYHATDSPWKSSRMRCPVRISSGSSSLPNKATLFLCPLSTSHRFTHLDLYPSKSSHTQSFFSFFFLFFPLTFGPFLPTQSYSYPYYCTGPGFNYPTSMQFNIALSELSKCKSHLPFSKYPPMTQVESPEHGLPGPL